MRDRGFDLAGRIEDRRDRGLYARLDPADRVAARARFAPDPGGGLPVLDDEEKLVFASNNYLGLARDDRVRGAAARAAEVVGTGAGARRLYTGDTMIHRDLEARLTEACNTDRALVFPSEYAATVGTVAALDPDVVFSDALNDPGIDDGSLLADADLVVYDHCDPADLERKLRSRAEHRRRESWLIATETLFGTAGTVAPLDRLCALASEYGAWLLADERHATGLFEGGGGIVRREGLGSRVQVQVGSLSTALGSQGGYVAGTATLVEYLANAARPFVFSAGLAPPMAAAAGEALHLARTGDRPEALRTAAERLREGLTDAGFEVRGSTHVCPVVVDDRERASAIEHALSARGIVAPAIPPRTPEHDHCIRLAPMATHSDAEITACVDAFADVGRKLELV